MARRKTHKEFIEQVNQLTNGEYVVLNGNQVGSLLVDYVLSNKAKEIETMKNPMIVKTIVTSELGAKIAKSYGVGCIDTLTGFKFIGEKKWNSQQKNSYS